MAETKRICTFLLRLIAFGTTLSAAIIMASSRERTTVLTLSFEAKYSDAPAFKYFVIANAIVSIYGFLLLFLPSESLLWRLVVALDVVFTMLLTSSISAALAIAYVGKKGNPNAVVLGSSPICLCERAMLSAGFFSSVDDFPADGLLGFFILVLAFPCKGRVFRNDWKVLILLRVDFLVML
ncbi:Casparian strip membrane protein domain - like 7 [Theobroma cacao]|nr:Casparian strip membrane protein domain - like 7 [Theobroma cacao]